MGIFCLCNNWLGWQALKWLRQQNDAIVGLAIHPAARAKYAEQIRAEVPDDCPVFDGSTLTDARVIQQIVNLDAEVAVSVLFGYVLTAEFMRLFPKGCINLHPALLPHNRGAFPNVWSIVSKTPAGVTLHYIDEGIDTGDIIAQQEVPVEITDTGASLYGKLETASLELFKKHWPSIRAGNCSRTPQLLGTGSSHRARDVRGIDEIDLQKSYRAEDLINILRARTFPPHPGAYFVHAGRKIYLRLDLTEEELEQEGLRDESKGAGK
jgi:methionyl-tRNA formyltransferase